MRESAIERYLHRRVEEQGGTTRKFTSPGRRAVMDRIIIWPRWSAGLISPSTQVMAAIHFVECKAPGEKAKPHQAREHVRFQKLGCVVLVLDTKEKIDNYIRKVMHYEI